MTEKKQYGFSLRIKKKNPKQNPDKYEIRTIAELFAVAKKLSDKDRKKLLRELAEGVEIAVHMDKVVMGVAEAVSETELGSDAIILKFTWYND